MLLRGVRNFKSSKDQPMPSIVFDTNGDIIEESNFIESKINLFISNK
jgi:hypothetical protein